jgi:hypothetical protein
MAHFRGITDDEVEGRGAVGWHSIRWRDLAAVRVGALTT